ncbi:hypothetical protein MNBD_ALPHA06-1045 [hydrothermal vent metagenome]|uniref:Lipid/polyisoprenoid-binding YceI-like domain-containing protein n=1 Tax=hydrothermal vent metagenome TaxID=652676 RepID=A0A3B0R909_9ZZZZ
MQMANPMRYHGFAVWLHWLIAGLILLIIPLGFLMVDAPDGLKLQLFQLHKTIGILILFLSLLRLGWRLLNPPPAALASDKAWQRLLSKMVHSSFYLLILATPLLGWFIVSTSSRGTPTMLFGQIVWPHIGALQQMQTAIRKQWHGTFEEMHEVAAFAIIALLLLHVGAAIKHQLLDKDNTMARITPGLLKTANPPAQKGRGAWVLLFGVLAIFAGWILLGASQAQPAPISATASFANPLAENAKMFTPNWQVDQQNSEIGFFYVKDGQQGFGNFAQWTAFLLFSPDELASAKAVIFVQANSVQSKDDEVGDSLPGPGWLDAVSHTQMTWSSEQFSRIGPDQYLATGRLQIRGISLPLDFSFQLQIDANGQAQMHGTARFNRLSFGIGADDAADGNWVADAIRLDIKMAATPITS